MVQQTQSQDTVNATKPKSYWKSNMFSWLAVWRCRNDDIAQLAWREREDLIKRASVWLNLLFSPIQYTNEWAENVFIRAKRVLL